MPISDEDWQTLRLLFKEAEDAIAEAEAVCGAVVIPAINQLRYAGHHILRIEDGTDSAESSEELERARRHCKRATYDAYDSIVSFLLDEFQQFQSDYAQVQIVPVIPNYLEIKKTARNARDLLIQARKDADRREDYYPQCSAVCQALSPYRDLLEDAREELNKAVKQHNRAVDLAWLGIAVTVITALVTALVAFQ